MSRESKSLREKVLINSAIASVKKQIAELEKSREMYIAAAAEARENGIASQYELAKSAIRIVSAQKLAVEQMLLNLQLSSQIKDVSEMTKSFSDGMKMLSGALSDSNGADFERVTKKVDRAMLSVRLKQDESDGFLAATNAALGKVAGCEDGDEIDRFIQTEATGGSLDDEIAELERQLKSKNIPD